MFTRVYGIYQFFDLLIWRMPCEKQNYSILECILAMLILRCYNLLRYVYSGKNFQNITDNNTYCNIKTETMRIK